VAKKVQVTLVDDIDESVAAETVSFGLDGATYEIDLSEQNAAELRDVLAKFVAHARRGGRPSRPVHVVRAQRGPAKVDREQTQAIRIWARNNDFKVSDRGRVPANVLDAYNSAH
jgi:hypothetical protein